VQCQQPTGVVIMGVAAQNQRGGGLIGLGEQWCEVGQPTVEHDAMGTKLKQQANSFICLLNTVS
jgi:hypothetical protein